MVDLMDMNESKYQSADFSWIDLYRGMPEPTPRPNWSAILSIASVLLALLAGVFLALCTHADPAATTQPAAIRAAWYQPVSSFQVWKDRGVNTLWGWENEGGATSVDAFLKAAASYGFGVILQSDARNPADQAALEAHWNDAVVVAICISPDEPDNGGGKSAGYMLDRTTYVQKKTGKPTVANLDGWHIQYMPDVDVAAFCRATTWIAYDWHIINHGDGIGALPTSTSQLARLSRLSGGKPLLTFVETGDQNLRVQTWAQQPYDATGKPWALRMRGPTVAEVVAEQRAYLGAGAGICYFSQRIGAGWEGFDDTPPDNSGALTAINSR